MKSTSDFPLKYFEWLFEEGIFKELKEFYSTPFDELGHIRNINKNEHIVTFLDIDKTSSKTIENTYSFEKFIDLKLQKELRLSKDLIELRFQSIYSNKKEVKAFHEILMIKIDGLKKLKSLQEFKWLKDYISQIEKTANNFLKPISQSGGEYHYSLRLQGESKEHIDNKIDKLYQLLTNDPPFISCNKEEFKRAFTGKELHNGIHWLVKTKNKIHYNKRSLVYFVERLIDHNHLSSATNDNINKHLGYTFRNGDGTELGNTRDAVAKTYKDSNVTGKERLNEIISSLK